MLSEVSHVTFRKLSERDIAAYLRTINPLDKAGGYAAQGAGAEVIERIDGSYSNVIGLPMEGTLEVLREFGIVSASQPVLAPRFARGGGDRVSTHGRETKR